MAAAGAGAWTGQSPVEAAIAALPSLYSLDLRGLYLGHDEVLQLTAALGAPQQLRLTSVDAANNRLSGEAADRLIRQLLARGVQLLDLSWNSLGPGDVSNLQGALQAAGTVLSLLDLDCNDLGDAGAAALAKALPGCRALKRLRLGGNRIGPEGGRALASVLPRSALRALELERNYLGPAGIAALAGAQDPQPHEGREGCQAGGCALESLHVSVNRARDQGAEALAKALAEGRRGFLPELEVLDLGSNLIGDAGVGALARALSTDGPKLRWLGLSRNKLSSVAGERLAEAVEAGLNSAIQAIALDGNPELPGPAAARVSTALRQNACSIVPFDPLKSALAMCQGGAHAVDLRGLHLGVAGTEQLHGVLRGPRVRVAELLAGDTGLGDEGLELLTGSLHCVHRTLKQLDLSWNRISSRGATCLAEALRRAGEIALESIDMDCNDLGDAGAAAFASLLGGPRPPAAPGDNEGLQSTGTGRSLQVLRLASNGIGPAGAASLAAALRGPRSRLTELEMSRNRLGPAGAAALAEALASPGAPLRVLGLAVNRVLDAGAETLAEALAARGPGQGVPVEFNLRGNLIGDAGAAALARGLSSGALLVLCLEFNKITGSGAAALAAGLRDRLASPLSAGAGVRVSLQGNPAGSSGEAALQEAFQGAAGGRPGGGDSGAPGGSKRQRLGD